MCLSAVHIITMPLSHLWPWIFALSSHSPVLVLVFLIYKIALSWSWSSLIEGIILKSILFASRLETLRVDFYSHVSYKIKMGLVDLLVVVACSDSFLSLFLSSPPPSSLCALCINKVVMIMNLSIWFWKIRLWIICKMPVRQAGVKELYERRKYNWINVMKEPAVYNGCTYLFLSDHWNVVLRKYISWDSNSKRWWGRLSLCSSAWTLGTCFNSVSEAVLCTDLPLHLVET